MLEHAITTVCWIGLVACTTYSVYKYWEVKADIQLSDKLCKNVVRISCLGKEITKLKEQLEVKEKLICKLELAKAMSDAERHADIAEYVAEMGSMKLDHAETQTELNECKIKLKVINGFFSGNL